MFNSFTQSRRIEEDVSPFFFFADPGWSTTRWVDGTYVTFTSAESQRRRGDYLTTGFTYLLCFSVGKRRSFAHIKQFLEQGAFESIVIVGIHLSPQITRVVSAEKGMQLAEAYGCPYFEVDLTTGCNMEELFYWIGKSWTQ